MAGTSPAKIATRCLKNPRESASFGPICPNLPAWGIFWGITMQVRMARTPHASYDTFSKRWIVNWRFPRAVQPLTGPFFRDRFPRALSPQQTALREAQKLAEFYQTIETARQRLATPEGQGEAVANLADKSAGIMLTVADHFVGLQRRHQEIIKKAELLDLAKQMGVEVNLPQTGAYSFEQCIHELWVPKRRRAGKSVSEKIIERLVGSKIRKLTSWLGHDDMRRVTRDKLETYFDTQFPGAAIGTIRDHIIICKALFAVAHDRQKINSNPAKPIWYSKDNDHPGRPFMPSERNAIIRAAWNTDDETVQWLWLLGCCYGPRIAEFAEAGLRDVVVENGIPVIFLDTLHRRGEEKHLKTQESTRWLPIHSALRPAFMARVERLRREYGENAPLFPNLRVYGGRRNKNASRVTNDWLDRLVKIGELAITDAANKSYHSMRHTVSTALEGRRWADFVTGHAGANTKTKVYKHPPLHEVVDTVESFDLAALLGPAEPCAKVISGAAGLRR